MSSWKDHTQTWKMMPVSSSVLFLSGVFCFFASLILIDSGMNFQSQSTLELIGDVLIGGGFAIGWAYAGTRRIIWLFFVMGLLQFSAFYILGWLSGSHHTLAAQEMEHKLRLNGYVGWAARKSLCPRFVGTFAPVR